MEKKEPKESKPTEPRRETRRLADLVPYPDQKKYFSAFEEYEYEVLKASIERDGLRHLIHVMPPGNAADLRANTIISGHHRREALIELGHEEYAVRVRYDLLTASRAAVDEIFLLDNIARRQQDRLGMARAAVGLYQSRLKQQGQSADPSPLSREELRDEIGRIIGVSGRTLARYLNVLETPIAVQDAFARKRIRLVDASRVRNLDPTDQEELAARLEAGEDAKAVLAEYLPGGTGKHVKAADALAAFARSLDKGRADLADRLDTILPNVVREYEQSLKRGRSMIWKLLQTLEPPTDRP